MLDWNGQIRGTSVAGDLLLVIGILLLVNAAGGFVFHPGAPDYRYDTVQITDSDQFLESLPMAPATIDCLGSVTDRTCALESAAITSGLGAWRNGTLHVPNHQSVSVERSDRPIIFVRDQGLYRRGRDSVRDDDGTNKHTITYEPINEQDALDSLAVPIDDPDLPATVRQIVEDGPITRSERLDLSVTVVETESGYELIERTKTALPKPTLGSVAGALQILLGIAAILRGRTMDSILTPILNRWNFFW